MAKQKMRKIREVGSFPNVYQYANHRDIALRNAKGEIVDFKGVWHQQVFQNNYPIVLELACGKGEYSLSLARKCSDKNIIGVDIKGPRLWKCAGTALTENIQNLRFIRTNIEFIDSYFAAGEVSEIWITFPDPFPRDKQEKKRLLFESFLKRYRAICRPGAHIHLKTDSLDLARWSKESVEKFGCVVEVYNEDIYPEAEKDEWLRIKTHYETLHLAEGNQICYLRFRFD